MRTTLADLKASRIPEAINIYPSDDRFLDFVNEAVRRLMTRGLYWGAYGTYDISVTSQLLTLPAHIETLEAISISQVILPIHDTFYQFVEAGWGPRDETCECAGPNECMLLGNYPTISDITTASVLNVSCDLATDAGKTVLILGYDENGNWIRTVQAGVYADGEVVTLAQTPGTNTTLQFSKVTDIQAPDDMDGQWWLYQGATMLGNYQHWETRPSWKRYLVPFWDNTPTARVIGRRAFVPVKSDADYPIIGNIAAIKLACMAIRAEEEHRYTDAAALWGGNPSPDGTKVVGAFDELDRELQFQLGVGREMTIDIKSQPYVEPLEPIQ